MEAVFLSLTNDAAELSTTVAGLRCMVARTGGVKVETRCGVPGLFASDVAALAEAEAERRAALAAHEEAHL